MSSPYAAGVTTTDRAATDTGPGTPPKRDTDAAATRRVALGGFAVIAALAIWLAFLAFTAEPRDCDQLYRDVQAGEQRHNGNQLPVSCR